jgi:terminal uridylyltransferase
MDSTAPQSPASLEAQLRNMILSNVSLPARQTNQESPQRGSQQQRGRGRGGVGRGLRANPPNQHSQGQNLNAYTAPTTSPALRGGRGTLQPQRGNRNRQQQQPSGQAKPQPAIQDGVTAGIQIEPVPIDKHPLFATRPPRQAQPHEQPRQAGQGPAANGQPAKAFQRPHANNGPRHFGSGSPNPQYPPRYYGHHMHQQHTNQSVEDPLAQVAHLDRLAAQEIPEVEMKPEEFEEKEAFRKYLEDVCKKALANNYSGDIATIALVGFGSLSSGFAMPGSDMDLAIVPEWKDHINAGKTEIDRDIPRVLEKAILNDKLGARLLTRTRVPILKVCQHPHEELYTALFNERTKWDELPEEEQYPPPVPPPVTGQSKPLLKADPKPSGVIRQSDFPELGAKKPSKADVEASKKAKPNGQKSGAPKKEDSLTPTITSQDTTESKEPKRERQPHHDKPWAREKILGPLDFPKSGVGIQCDINFENPLGIHNTQLLRCYSLCDPRVRPMVLFVKSWSKRRKINSSYSGTLSSYGWVLMVLHYLVNVAQPPVCPNLQLCRQAAGPQGAEQIVIQGYPIRFWRNEAEIKQAAKLGQLSQNTQSIGALLRGFYQYYASLSSGYGYNRTPSFHWTGEVLSLRTPGGLQTKQMKGWTGAKTTISNGKEVRHRYLFSIEDPFEVDHNVARTVTHNGIVAIRDEFRRAWRILSAIGRATQPEGDIFDVIVEKPPPSPTPEIKAVGDWNMGTGPEEPASEQVAVGF